MTQTPTDSNALLKRRRTLNIFACTIAVSLLLHLVAAVVFLLPGRFTRTTPAPVLLELQNLSIAPPPAAPVAANADSAPQSLPTPAPTSPPPSASAPEPPPEMAKLVQAVADSLQKAQQTPEAVHESDIGLGMLSGYFASFAEGATLKDDIRVYYFSLMRRINEVWWTSGAAKGSFANSAALNLLISRDGKVIACDLFESSGNQEQDKALLAAVKAAEPLPPLPQSYRWPTFKAPIRFAPPLRLMLPGFPGKGKLSIGHGG